jgi:hypothetical protein
MGGKAGLTARQVSPVEESLPRRVRVKDHTLRVDPLRHNATHLKIRKKDPHEFRGRKRKENKMPNVNGKKFPYTKKGKAAAKAYKAKSKMGKKPVRKKRY